MPALQEVILLDEDDVSNLGTYTPRGIENSVAQCVYPVDATIPSLDRTLRFSGKELPDGRNKVVIKLSMPIAVGAAVGGVHPLNEYDDNTAFVQCWTSPHSSQAERDELMKLVIASVRASFATSLLVEREGVW